MVYIKIFQRCKNYSPGNYSIYNTASLSYAKIQCEDTMVILWQTILIRFQSIWNMTRWPHVDSLFTFTMGQNQTNIGLSLPFTEKGAQVFIDEFIYLITLIGKDKYLYQINA